MSRATDRTDRTDAILERLLRDLDRGAEPDSKVLREMFPGDEATVERLCGLVREYRQTLSEPSSPSYARAKLDLKPGDLLGDYVIESRLAEGGMSVVYRARQRSLGMRLVALKVVPDGGDPDHTRRFEREALLAASLHHPSLAEVYGFGSDGLCLYYAMQLVEGPTLRDVLEEHARLGKPLDRDTLRAIVDRVAEVAAALECAHRAGLVHRDVKPGNIVLAPVDGAVPTLERSRAILVDFGLARRIDPDVRTRARETSATPAYAAPEQLVGGEVDARADVFSLGATLHDLLVGRLPQGRVQASAGLEPVASLAPEVDRDLAAIVGRAVDPVARWRYADAGELLTDLRAWQTGAPVSARRRRLGERASRWLSEPRNARRSALLLSLLMSGLVLGIAADQAWTNAVRDARRDWSDFDLVSALDAQDLPRPVRMLALPRSFNEFLDASESWGRTGFEIEGTKDPSEPVRAAHLAVLVRSGELSRSRGDPRRYFGSAGWGHSPILTRFVAHEIRKQGQDASAGDQPASSGRSRRMEREGRAALWELALDVSIRTPDLGPDRSASAPIRNAASERLNRGAYGVEALYLLGILAGCGTIDDVDTILDWRERVSADLGTEGSRQALFAIEGILRRERQVHPPGQGGPRIPAVTLTRLRDLLGKVPAASNGNLASRVKAAAIECVAALVLLQSDEPWPPAWESDAGWRWVITCFQSMGGESIDGHVDQGLSELQREVQAGRAAESAAMATVGGLGLLTGFTDPVRLMPQTRERLRQMLEGNAYASGLLEEFEGVSDGSPGIRHLWTMGWKYPQVARPATAEALDVSFTAPMQADDELLKWFPRLRDPNGANSNTRLLGAWDFRLQPFRAQPSPSSVRILGCTPPSPVGKGTELRLTFPGVSRVELRLDVPSPKLPQKWGLYLLAQIAGVDYRPYQGRAVLRVRVGEEEVCAPITVQATDEFVYGATLQSSLLPSGPSMITIELDPDSPSQCWIRFAAVSQP